MKATNRYILLILIVLVTLFFFYRTGNTYSSHQATLTEEYNLSNPPTGTPKPSISRFIKEAMKNRPRPRPDP